MRKVFRKPLILLPSLLVMISVTYIACKRSGDSSVGPAYYSAPAGFAPTLDIPASTANFGSGGTVAPNTNLGTKVTWTLVYKGLTSGAVKTFSGSSDFIDAGNALWNGGHDGLYFFKPGEKVEATLSFIGTNYTTKDYVNINTARDFITGNPNIVGVGGSNNGYEVVSSPYGYGSFGAQFSIASGNANCQSTFVDPDVIQIRQDTIIPAVEGLYSFQNKGKSKDANGYFIGGLQHRVSSGFYLPTNWKNPDSIYFNIYVYGTGDPAAINLEFHEADSSNIASKTPFGKAECGLTGGNCGTIFPDMHDPCSDDAWVYQYPVKHTGWKLISVKFSDMPVSGSLPNGGSGNKIKEPTRIARVQIGVISAPPFSNVSAIWDYPVITYGGPFDPSK